MRVALVNPPWSFEGSTYFGCREPHLPLEYGYASALLERAGHEARLFDAQPEGLSFEQLARAVGRFAPDMTVLTTAPSYLFWRCAPPELRVPMAAAQAMRGAAGRLVAVGPHASTAPRAVLRKLEADAAVLGECEEAIVELASTPPGAWAKVASVALRGGAVPEASPRSVDVASLPAIRWDSASLARHTHHHHRFDAPADGPGAELEASRGCPYRCTFCAKEQFRDRYRKRPLATVLAELDGLVAAGARYAYFVDEIFLPDAPLLDALAVRRLPFGVQLRIDGWSRDMLDRLGRAGCVSIEAGVESVSPEGRARLAKACRRSTDELVELLVHAKRAVPFVQANLLEAEEDDARDVAAFRGRLLAEGVWANDPVPLFPYPGSPEYTRRFGALDDRAWERAHADYLGRFGAWSDVQEQTPRPLDELEGRGGATADG